MIRGLLRYTHHLTGAIFISFLIGMVAELAKVVVLVLAAMMLLIRKMLDNCCYLD